jgi:adenylate kinase
MSTAKIAIVGPSGSGKGTQRVLLSQNTDLPSVSMGDLLRSAAKLPGELNETIKKRLQRGEHVDNEVASQLMFDWLDQNGQNGYIIEGYPRNLEQYNILSGREQLTHVVVLKISDLEVEKRITGRRVCECGATYHLTYKPPASEGICDKCGKELFIRTDNTSAATAQRIRLYHEQMVPVIELFEKQGICQYINGEQEQAQVQAEILKAIGYADKK